MTLNGYKITIHSQVERRCSNFESLTGKGFRVNSSGQNKKAFCPLELRTKTGGFLVFFDNIQEIKCPANSIFAGHLSVFSQFE